MIYDCFLYNGEKDLLEIRMNELKGLDVMHVLVQSEHTFSGIIKDRSLLSLPYDYKGAIKTECQLTNPNPWDNERALRNSIKDFLLNPHFNIQDDDIVIISDCDEIPRASAIKDWSGNEYAALIQNKYGFWLNCEEEHKGWHRSRLMKWSYLKTTTPEEVRNACIPARIENAGHHFSWMGGIEEVMRKFKSFSHQEEGVQKHAVREELERKIIEGESLWGSDKWKIVPIDESFPEHIRNNQEKFKHLIYNAHP